MNDKENYDISEEEASYFSIIPPLVIVFSCAIFPKLSDVIGRKKTLLTIAVPQLGAWILTAVARNVYFFYASRICSGLSISCMLSVLPIYISEVISPKIRGTFGCFLTSMHYAGQFVINVLGNYFDVKTTSYICAPAVLIFVMLFLLMPESPHYYAMKNLDRKAIQALQIILRKSIVDKEFATLKKDIETQMLERGSWKQLITIDSNRKAISIALFLRIIQQLGGVTVFISSIQYIFENAGGAVRSDIAAMVFTFSIILVYSAAGYLVDKIGRKPAFTISEILTSVVLFGESVYLYIATSNPGIDLGVLNWFPFVGMMFYVVVVSFGPGIVPTIMIGEIFSANIKAHATIVVMFIYGVFGYLAHELFFSINFHFGLFGPFLLFSVINVFGAVLGYFYLPETKGKTLEEIQQDLKGNGKDRQKN